MSYLTKLFTKTKPLAAFLGLLLIPAAIFATPPQGPQQDYAPYPQPDRGYVTDIANILTAGQQERLESLLYATEAKRGTEIVIVIINSIKDYPGTANGSIESFATGLFNAYGVGDLPKNDGVLLVIAIMDRDARIELGSYYGHRKDADAERIMQKIIIPRFRQGDYAGGIMDGAKALTLEFAGIRIIPGWVKIAVLAAIAVLIPICISLFRNGKRGWGWILVGAIIILVLAFLQLLARTLKTLPKGAGAGGFGGGFGGGSSGGGGATGHW